MLKMVDGTGIIGVDMVCPLGVSTPQPPNYDRVELEGAGMLVLPNSLDAPLERLELGGKTEQVQTSGKQLFDKENLAVGVLENDGSIAYSNNYYTSDYIAVEPNTKYICTRTGSKRLKFYSVDKQPIQTVNFSDANVEQGGSFTTRETTKYVRFSVMGDYINTVMFTSGVSFLPYEPYTGGKPSPSPEYPQEIKNSGKWNEETQKYEVDVKVTGKNLLNLQKEPDVKGTYQGWKVGNGELLTLGVKDKGNNADIKGCYIGFSYQGSEPKGVVWVVDNGVIKTNPLNQRKAYVSIFPANETTVKKLTERFDIQCELGNVATPYQPYKEQTLTLTSDRPLTKWDRLVEQGGQIGWLYNSVNETIDGKTGKWSIQPASKIFYRTDITFPIVVPFCIELLGYDYSMGGYKKDTGITINNLGILCITLPEEVELTLDAYKQYLADNPLHVLYKGDSEEFVPLPQSEQNAIRALKTYYPTTVITADGGELDPDIKVTYRKEI